MEHMAQRMNSFKSSVFAEMTALAIKHGAINLGQGFPDFPAPQFLKKAAARAIDADINQYAPSNGHPGLRRALAAKMARHYGLNVNPDAEMVITNGATEAIFATFLGLTDPGDEVILFEPFYDSYVPSIRIAGGVPRFYTLRPPDWSIDRQKLAALFNDRTKLILINTPHNPTGKLFSKDDLQFIAQLCRQHDVIAVSDEVYEHIIFDGHSHHCLATLPGMADRCVTISSLGKSFSVTGWKVGWAIGAEALIQPILRGHQFITFCGAAPLQAAAVSAVEIGAEYYTELTTAYQQRRDYLVAALQEVGLRPVNPCGTYFIMAEIGHLGFADDVSFCRHLTSKVGVAAIPPSSFYHDSTDGAQLARFAFCKSMDTLVEAASRLRKHLRP
jgi:N-succinyldiaminopimelate aminotransferase